ncbi:class I SAM-dependent methyltransferase [Candidatus Nitrospira salsa]|nr:MAG: hypothetical protein NPIRA01_04670 [Nitrospirales bacterium]
MLQLDDLTPLNFEIPSESFIESSIKKPIRRYVYPLYNCLTSHLLAKRYRETIPFRVDRWLWGQRGSDYERHRRRVNRYLPLAGKDILIAGCGTGQDIPTWFPYAPRSVTGIDLFNYQTAWTILQQHLSRVFPDTAIMFAQRDLACLNGYADETFDVIASDALFEHLSDLSSVLKEFRRLLRKDGLLYATFGPLWYSWGGDHISGSDDPRHGYNHLLLKQKDYHEYLNSFGMLEHSAHDGRTWIKEGLFSYLSPSDYCRKLEESGYERLFTSLIIDPRAVKFLKMNVQERHRLERIVAQATDLLVTGMTVIYKVRRNI